jgi:predicted membrane channel-forming protein YqfA (hemolysin III family)
LLSDSTSFFRQWRPPTSAELVDLCVFGLGQVTLIEGWLGYHGSVTRRPVRGWFPFSMDILLVLTCTLMLAQYQHFDRVLLLIVAVFGGYTLWDSIGWVEEHRRPVARDFTSLGWLLVLIVLSLLYFDARLPLPTVVWAIIAGACVVLYRIDKATTLFTRASLLVMR